MNDGRRPRENNDRNAKGTDVKSGLIYLSRKFRRVLTVQLTAMVDKRDLTMATARMMLCLDHLMMA